MSGYPFCRWGTFRVWRTAFRVKRFEEYVRGAMAANVLGRGELGSVSAQMPGWLGGPVSAVVHG